MAWVEALMPFVLIGMFVACAVVLVLMRDPRHTAPRVFSRWVFCQKRQHGTIVEVSERMQTGMVMQTVRSCPLRRRGEWCGQMCVMNLAEPETPAAP